MDTSAPMELPQPASSEQPERRAPQPGAASSPIRIYKLGQGRTLRWGTAAALGVTALAFAAFIAEHLAIFSITVRTLIPVAIFVASSIGVFWLVGRYRAFIDFLIATEGEMKKVNWSTRREVFGATRVVIVTLFALGTVLFLVDVFFMAFFELIGVLRIGMLDQIFGGGGGLQG